MAPSVRPRWARISASNGAILRQRGATDSAKIDTGEFTVTFSSPVANCGWTATLNGMNTDGLHPDGELSVRPGGSRVLNIQHFNSDGEPAEIPTGISSNTGFTVAVYC